MSRITVQGSDIAITNPEKLLWHGIGMRKIDYIQALITLAPYLLPHTVDRALTAIRYPDGIGQASFYQKRPPKNTPEWVDNRGGERRCIYSPEFAENAGVAGQPRGH